MSCDLNYRKNLWKYGKKASEIMPELVAGCDVILGNEEDAEKVSSLKVSMSLPPRERSMRLNSKAYANS